MVNRLAHFSCLLLLQGMVLGVWKEHEENILISLLQAARPIVGDENDRSDRFAEPGMTALTFARHYQ